VTLANGCDTNPREIEGYWRQFGRRFGHQLPTSTAMHTEAVRLNLPATFGEARAGVESLAVAAARELVSRLGTEQVLRHICWAHATGLSE